MYSHNLRLDPFDILRLVAIPGEPGVFALPTRERPTRIVSQQRRALTLAHALLESQISAGTKPYEFRLAVIGGGFGGVTAALYAAQAGARVTLFERKGELLHRFNGSPRHIDPRIADWPDDTWMAKGAGLRILDWSGTSAGVLARDALDIVRRAPAITNLQVQLGAEVKLLPPSEPGAPRRLMWSTDGRSGTDVFDAVLIATGFGEERKPNGWVGDNPSYWKPDRHLTDAVKTVAIIGNGDGALMEIARLLGVPIEDHRKQAEVLLKGETGKRVIRTLREHEARWRFDRDTSGHAGDRATEVSKIYFKELGALTVNQKQFPTPLHPELKHIYVFGRSADLLTLDAYAINRVLVALLLRQVDSHATGRYESRDPGQRIAVDYICADAVIEKESSSYRLRALPPGASAAPPGEEPVKWGVVEVNAVIPRLGPESSRDEWATLALRGREDAPRNKGEGDKSAPRESRINLTQLNLLERNVPTHVLERAGGLGSWPTLASETLASEESAGSDGARQRQRLRFGSEFYDTYIQKLARQQMNEFLTVYVGKLRFDTLLWNTVILPDAQILDGCFFHGLTASTWPAVESLIAKPTKGEDRAKVAIYARDADMSGALTQFLAGTKHERRKIFPELSASEEAELPTRLDLTEAEFNWEAIKNKLPTGNDTAKLVERLDALIARFCSHWGPNAESWTTSYYVIPSLDVFDILKSMKEPEFNKLEKEVGATIRARLNRTDVFNGIRKATKGDPLTLPRGGLSEFVAWYNSSYNLGIFHRANADAGEFLWIPTKARSPDDAERIGGLCMVCLGGMRQARFDEVRAKVRKRRDLRGRLERAVGLLDPLKRRRASTEPRCMHVPVVACVQPGKPASKAQTRAAETVAETLRRWGGRVSVEITPTGWRYVSGSGKSATVLGRVEFTE